MNFMNLKTLENGTQIKVFTCPCCDDTMVPLYDELDKLLPPKENGFNEEYVEAFMKNYSYITSFLSKNTFSYDKLPLYAGSTSGDCSNAPVLTLTELRNCYQAMVCPYFRPYFKNDFFWDNEFLQSSSIPSIQDFYNLSEKDKQIITQRQ